MEFPAWAYKSRSSDPDLIKSAVGEMADAVARVNFVDSVICHFDRPVLSAMDVSAMQTSENMLTVNFKNGQIELPQLALSSEFLPSCIDDSFIRYAAFILPPDCEIPSKEMHVVALSTWQKKSKDIHNIYLVMNQSEALLIMNAVSRLISRQSMTKTFDFYPLVTGRVMISSCTLERHSGQKTDCCSPQKLMFFILDPESLSFFEHCFSNKPAYDFRFYKEQGPRVIDIVFVSKDFSHIQLQQQTQVYMIRKNLNSKTDEEAYDKLLQIFRKNVAKPQSEEYFMNPEKHTKPVMASHVTFERSSNDWKWESGWQNSRQDDQVLLGQWLNDLYTGDHIHRRIDDEMQLMWVTVEHDLTECIESGAVPDSIIESSGVDPLSHNHLQLSLEDIKDQLLNNDMVLALSRLNACLMTYKDTLLQPVSKVDQMELMKRIYFLSSRE